MSKRFLFIFVIIISIASMAACSNAEQAGDLQTVSRTVGLEGAQAADVNLRMGAGNLVIDSGAAGLVEANFTFNVAAWEPEVSYNVIGQQGTLIIRQPADISLDPDLTDAHYDWSIRLGNSVPVMLDVEMGAGSATINASDLSLSGFDLAVGAGQLDLDMSGGYSYDLAGQITGGVGDVNITLPNNMGVIVNVEGGLGNIIATGLQRQNGALVNQAYGTVENTLQMNIAGGVGEVELTVAE